MNTQNSVITGFFLSLLTEGQKATISLNTTFIFKRFFRRSTLKMTSVTFSFRGLMAPVFTPFDENQNLDLRMIPDYAEYLDTYDIKGILVNGTTGEGVSMSLEERKNVLEAWVEACRPHNQIIMAQVGGTNMKNVKDLARHAEECKVAAILCLADLFFKPSNVNDLIHYLKIVSMEAPNTPLLYYHIPSFTGINLNMKEFIIRSSEIPTFAGIKFTDNDLVMGSSLVTKVFEKHRVFLGCDNLFLSALLQGFDSAIGTTINIFPNLNKTILRHFQEKNFENAAKTQALLNNYIKQITDCGSWVSSMKAAMNKLTPIKVGPVRDPLVNVNLNFRVQPET